jgi:hypothetical protein
MTVKTTRKTFDPYAIMNARDMVKLMARGVNLPQVGVPLFIPLPLPVPSCPYSKLIDTLCCLLRIGCKDLWGRDCLRRHQDRKHYSKQGAFRQASTTYRWAEWVDLEGTELLYASSFTSSSMLMLMLRSSLLLLGSDRRSNSLQTATSSSKETPLPPWDHSNRSRRSGES